MLNKILPYIEFIAISSVIWVILNEQISIFNICLGALLGVATIFITNHLLRLNNYYDTVHIRCFWLLKYVLFVILQIYMAGFSTIYKIISGNINPDFVTIDTSIENDLDICILANSITLTPGTVTIDKVGQQLLVLWIDCRTKDSKEAGELIKGKFEKILLKKG